MTAMSHSQLQTDAKDLQDSVHTRLTEYLTITVTDTDCNTFCQVKSSRCIIMLAICPILTVCQSALYHCIASLPNEISLSADPYTARCHKTGNPHLCFHHPDNASPCLFHYFIRKHNLFPSVPLQAMVNVHQGRPSHIITYTGG